MNATHRPSLVVTRTPLRVSFAGGGTDLPGFYEREYGAVLSTTIDKYLYVTVKRHNELFHEGFRLNYSQTEHVNRLDEIQNHIARECLRLLQVEPPIYISTVADLPEFSGLGSSSSFAVGLLNALHSYRGEGVSAAQLAEEASRVEVEVLKRPIGKQDHYAAAVGGLNFFCFMPDGKVTVEHQRIPEGVVRRLFEHLLMFWTGIQRDAGAVLTEQQRNTPQRLDQLRAMREHARALQRLVSNGFDPLTFGRVLDQTWQLKRQLASTITNDRIDAWYHRAKAAGATGGKICGAGGGGFLLLVMPPDRRDAARKALQDLTDVPIHYEAQGSRVLLPFGE
ncbi:MAG TPA: GHMP kinase [Candidatus Omnitrophica bacterium]|nr:GHMP kinase [Candidatus Omnitrophota bacterium]